MSKEEKQEILRDQIYQRLSEALRRGKFVPGEKITIRTLAAAESMSSTPAREALHRLVSDGVLEAEANRSAKVPILSVEQIGELKEIRLLLEATAAERAAKNSTPTLVAKLRAIASDLAHARTQGDKEADLSKVYEFQFTLYRACGMPALVKMIEGLWLRSGPYLNLLFPGYINTLRERRGDWREKICLALERNDVQAVREEIERDIGEALSYVADVVAAASAIKQPKGRR